MRTSPHVYQKMKKEKFKYFLVRIKKKPQPWECPYTVVFAKDEHTAVAIAKALYAGQRPRPKVISRDISQEKTIYDLWKKDGTVL